MPAPLPPVPAIQLDGMLTKLGAADRAIGRLDGINTLLPDKALFLYMYVRKEAVLSSQIEGTQSTLTDLLRFETEAASGVPIDDIREVSNYVDAMMYGLERLRSLPLFLRLVREMHARLLQSGRGQSKNPGEFRTSQNWIGGTRPGNAAYVPPPVTELIALPRRFRKIHSYGNAEHSAAYQGGTSACPVREHPPLSGWRRPSGASSDHALSVLAESAPGTAALPQPLF